VIRLPRLHEKRKHLWRKINQLIISNQKAFSGFDDETPAVILLTSLAEVLCALRVRFSPGRGTYQTIWARNGSKRVPRGTWSPASRSNCIWPKIDSRQTWALTVFRWPNPVRILNTPVSKTPTVGFCKAQMLPTNSHQHSQPQANINNKLNILVHANELIQYLVLLFHKQRRAFICSQTIVPRRSFSMLPLSRALHETT
jgi:hypothetical protein